MALTNAYLKKVYACSSAVPLNKAHYEGLQNKFGSFPNFPSPKVQSSSHSHRKIRRIP